MDDASVATSRARPAAGTGTSSREETFVVLRGTLSMYLGEPPERHDVPQGGTPPDEGAKVLEPAV